MESEANYPSDFKVGFRLTLASAFLLEEALAFGVIPEDDHPAIRAYVMKVRLDTFRLTGKDCLDANDYEELACYFAKKAEGLRQETASGEGG
jgi:hypothetical protein